MITSMTGYASKQFQFEGEAYKIEVKTLNHRFLDLKVRLPRTLSSLESALKATLEARVKRGSVDFWVERLPGPKAEAALRLNPAQVQGIHAILEELRSQFQFRGEPSLGDLLQFPDLLVRENGEEWPASKLSAFRAELEGCVGAVLNDLLQMRQAEGSRLKAALLEILTDLRAAHSRIHGLREQIQVRARERIKRRIETCFEAYPVSDDRVRALMDSRIAQEISYSLEKLDVEEELTRFIGHVSAIEQLLHAGGAVGKKLDFIFQELNREVNTLANKSQDLEISAEVIELKMRVEQMREQSLNLE